MSERIINDITNQHKIVTDIIEKAMAEMPAISKHYVLLEIESQIHPNDLVVGIGEIASDSSTKNVRMGANKVFHGCMANLDQFVIDPKGLIRRK